ncbi:hypothetical protein B566_EDAN001907 [Ephemera danica]|nr:hypothetical protein B566_EDAN001907 [Ephemera danica]
MTGEPDDRETICDSVASLVEGCRLPVRMRGGDDWLNKRLDEWVTEERLDTRKVQFPRKDIPASHSGLQTPKKIGGGCALPSSRPCTPPPPITTTELLNGNAVLAAALQKKLTRKRKLPSIEVETVPAIPEAPPTPGLLGSGGAIPASTGVESPGKRTSGSLVTHHHDDVVTRMKNVEMIELGPM